MAMETTSTSPGAVSLPQAIFAPPPAGGRPRCVHHFFEEQAARTPDATALVHGTESLSYRELDRRANRLAHALRRRGAGLETRVGICARRSVDLVVGLLGIVKSGAAYVPLDPAYPRERIALTLRDARAPLAVTQRELVPLLQGHAGGLLLLDADREEIDREPAEAPESGAGPDNLAYLIYTSGSTGTPKGVQIEHRSAVALLHWCREVYTPAECAGVLGSTSVCFDMSVFEVFHTLGVGGTLFMAENALELPRLAARDRVTLINTVPSAAAELLREGGIPASVRTVNLGGEALRGSLAQGLYALPHVQAVYNLYGPTEDTTYSTWLRVERGAEREPTVGRAVTGTRIHVLDAGLDAVAEGGVGEVYLAGDGLTRGYLGRPELTAEKFLPDPFSAEPGARMYRVGDLGRILPDGELEYLGRVDHQVKVRGFRVELGEIETALGAHPGVREAAVTARDDEAGGKALAAYFVPVGGAPAPAELRAWLRERLPEYMVPAAFVALDEFPRTPSGKTDRLALPAPGPAHSGEGTAYAAPRTPTEEAVAAIWAEVLGAERVGVHEHFFDLGGHSLRAAQIVARLRSAFRVDLPMGALFDAPTVAELAALVEAAGGAGEEVPPLVPVPRDRPLPLSFSQEAIWFFQELAPGMKSYNFQASFRLRGDFDPDVLETALAEIIRRHEIFRTTFHDVGGAAVQTVHEDGPLHLPRFDLRGLPEAERDEAVRRHMAEEFGAPFELGQLPLIRWRLLRLADDEHVLLQVEHHFVHDGWSFAVFLRELVTLYTAFAEGRPSPLPELPVQFADFAVWHRRLMEGERARADVAYWKEALSGADPVLELPTDRPRPATISFRGASLRARMPAATARAARAFCRETGATLYMTLLAAFEALMGRYSGQEDFCLGGGVANRSWKETEGLIGMIVNTIAHRVRLDRVRTFRELVEQVRDTAREAYAHKDVHFGQVVEAVAPERSLSRLPIYQVTFNFHDSPYPDLRLPGVEVELTEALSNGSAKFDFQVIMMPRAEMRAGAPEDLVEEVWEYATDLFDASTVERMAAHYHHLLGALLAEPDRPLRELPLADAAEIAGAAAGWSAPAPAAPGLCIHRLFEARADRAPDAVALVQGEESLTYGELDCRADRLARRLIELGVVPDSRVAVCLERTPELVVALLAVFKAGGACVPLDPAYPAERLAFILGDAAPAVLVTRADLDAALPEAGVLVLFLDRDVPAGEPAGRPAVEVGPEHLAYVVYTSGSTGTPKGSMLPHRSVPGVLLGVDYVRLDPEETLLQHSSHSWDAAILELWGALLNGGRCVLYPGRTPEPEGIEEQVKRHGVTTLWLPSALFNLVVESRPGALAGVRQLVVGGEALSAPHARRALEEHPGLRLVNGYGPSECMVFTTCHVVAPDFAGASVPIGRPIGDRRAYLLDEALNPVPAGVPGELFVGGPAVARGYLDRPGLTAGRFLPDPHGEPGARMYRTGDRVRRLDDGTLEFLGRVDQQLKVRGFRVEPGEVEAVLATHPRVGEAVVTARGATAADRMLVAYVTPAGDAAPSAAELRAWLRERLPEYMVPAAYVALDSIPLTPNGKTDRRALPAPEQSGPAAPHVAPRTPVEEEVAAIWAEVLGLETVGVHDNFFEHGGHSLRATQVVSRVRGALGAELSLRDLFDAPTVAEFAARVEARRPPASAEAIEDRLEWLESLSEEEALRLLGEL
ncbi:MAG TPA: amino acid adenylation domain-containing protein [Longimicrobiaceae bacterium]|jgi:amino acid adenylation domain-containing protein